MIYVDIVANGWSYLIINNLLMSIYGVKLLEQ